MLEKIISFGALMLGSFVVTHMVLERHEAALEQHAAETREADARREAAEKESALRQQQILQTTEKIDGAIEEVDHMVRTWKAEMTSHFAGDATFRGVGGVTELQL